MKSNPLLKAAILALSIVTAFILFWEMYWRGKGFTPTHNDDKVLWATKRKEIYQPSTVFIGGSRIKFDLDIPTWEKITGEKAVQLAIVGTPARKILRDLSNDQNFRGKLVIDITEQQFFTFDSMRREESATEALDYYYNETPAQHASAIINRQLESQLVFLEEGKFSLDELLTDLEIPNRPGVFSFPVFPKQFGLTTVDRQTYMNEEFLSTPKLQARQSQIWTMLMIGRMEKSPSMQGEELETFLRYTKLYVDKIRSRGGQVVFVRPPSSGPLREAEKKYYPREAYWDRLLAYTNTAGIHFEDIPETSALVCPEMSHLSSKDALTFTENLAKALHQRAGWAFPRFNTASLH